MQQACAHTVKKVKYGADDNHDNRPFHIAVKSGSGSHAARNQVAAGQRIGYLSGNAWTLPQRIAQTVAQLQTQPPEEVYNPRAIFLVSSVEYLGASFFVVLLANHLQLLTSSCIIAGQSYSCQDSGGIFYDEFVLGVHSGTSSSYATLSTAKVSNCS